MTVDPLASSNSNPSVLLLGLFVVVVARGASLLQSTVVLYVVKYVPISKNSNLSYADIREAFGTAV